MIMQAIPKFSKSECLLYYGIILKRSQKGGAYKIETYYL